jgi:hypothetical protein
MKEFQFVKVICIQRNQQSFEDDCQLERSLLKVSDNIRNPSQFSAVEGISIRESDLHPKKP